MSYVEIGAAGGLTPELTAALKSLWSDSGVQVRLPCPTFWFTLYLLFFEGVLVMSCVCLCSKRFEDRTSISSTTQQSTSLAESTASRNPATSQQSRYDFHDDFIPIRLAFSRFFSLYAVPASLSLCLYGTFELFLCLTLSTTDVFLILGRIEGSRPHNWHH